MFHTEARVLVNKFVLSLHPFQLFLIPPCPFQVSLWTSRSGACGRFTANGQIRFGRWIPATRVSSSTTNLSLTASSCPNRNPPSLTTPKKLTKNNYRPITRVRGKMGNHWPLLRLKAMVPIEVTLTPQVRRRKCRGRRFHCRTASTCRKSITCHRPSAFGKRILDRINLSCIIISLVSR